MENTQIVLRQKDYLLGMTAGALTGLLILPILKNSKPELFYQLYLFIVPFFLVAVPTGLFLVSLLSRKIAAILQLAKFAVVGGLNTVVDIGFLALISLVFKKLFQIESTHIMLAVGGGITFYSLYKILSFVIANINSYFWNKYWTFKAAEKKSAAEFAQFFAVSVIGILLNVVVASYVFTYVTPFGGLNIPQWELIGAVVGSFTSLTWNFVGYKFIVFKK